MEQGPVEAKIIEQCVREGLPLPERIANAPEILPGLQIYFIGFLDLSSSRQIGMGIGAIPWKAIFDYCEAKGLDEEQSEAMHHHIRVMDTAYIQFKSKKG